MTYYTDKTVFGRTIVDASTVADQPPCLTAHYHLLPSDHVVICLVVPTLPDDEATKLFPKGFRKVKPYLRYTPQPNIEAN